MPLRTPLFRRFISAHPRAHPSLRRYAAVHPIRLLGTQPTILEKYQAKLIARAKQSGMKNIDELKTAYADKIAEVRKADAELPPGALVDASSDVIAAVKESEMTSSTGADSTVAKVKNSAAIKQAKANAQANRAAAEAITKKSQGPRSSVKPLGDILDLEKASQLPGRELTAIWRLRHAQKDNTLCAVIPAATYRAVEEVAKRAPQFVLPVPHPEQGAEIHFLQWTFDAVSKTSSVLFTQLAEYKMRGEFAQPHTTITHHLDLADDKGLVLMQGVVVTDRGVKVSDAQFLVMCMQKFYGAWEKGEETNSEKRRKLVEYFSKGDSKFNLQDLLEETERLV